MYFYFLWREYPHGEILQTWEQPNIVPTEQLLAPRTCKSDRDTIYVDHNIQQEKH